MKYVCATELMKRLKFIEESVNEIYHNDSECNEVLCEKVEGSKTNNGYVPAYQTTYDFLNNRKSLKELFKEECEIKHILNIHNLKTKIEGFDFTIDEGLVKIAQLRNEIKLLTNLSRKSEYTTKDSYREGTNVYKINYSLEDAKRELKEAQKLLSSLQVAIDRANLVNDIEVKD